MRASSYKTGNYADQHPFEGEGVFLKGNLHTHTTATDGKLTQEEILTRYAAAGYDFLSITDHYLYTNRNAEELILFPGVEINYDDKEHYSFDHIVGVLLDPDGGYPDGLEVAPYPPAAPWSVQRMIDELRSTGHFVIYAHPSWSRRDLTSLAHLEGYDAIEVYNTCCDLVGAGYADQHYDSLILHGKRPFAVCTDDTHTEDCLFGGWVCVKARERSREAIAEALRAGRFYTSQGPEIYDYVLKDGIVTVDCSPASAVRFITYDHWGKTVRGNGITHAQFRLRGDEYALRIEIVDEKGLRAFSQPLYFY